MASTWLASRKLERAGIVVGHQNIPGWSIHKSSRERRRSTRAERRQSASPMVGCSAVSRTFADRQADTGAAPALTFGCPAEDAVSRWLIEPCGSGERDRMDVACIEAKPLMGKNNILYHLMYLLRASPQGLIQISIDRRCSLSDDAKISLRNTPASGYRQ
jgi:hypothetical protein